MKAEEARLGDALLDAEPDPGNQASGEAVIVVCGSAIRPKPRQADVSLTTPAAFFSTGRRVTLTQEP